MVSPIANLSAGPTLQLTAHPVRGTAETSHPAARLRPAQVHPRGSSTMPRSPRVRRLSAAADAT